MTLINRWLEKVEKFITAVCVMVMSVLLILNVLMRTFFNNSLVFTEEISRFLLITMTFIGSSYAARVGRHIYMSAIYDMFPIKVRRLLMTLIALITAIVLFAVAYFCFQYVYFLYESGRVSNALRFPMYLLMIFVPIGMFMTSLQFLFTAVINIKRKDGPYISISKKDTEVEINEV